VLFPSYPAFAAGFVLWGAGSALRSGTVQALVYEELRRVGAAGAYARLAGRSEAVGLLGVVAASAVAAPVLAAGGYRAAGAASAAGCAACAACAVAGARGVGGGGGGGRVWGVEVGVGGGRGGRCGRWSVRGGRGCAGSPRCGGRWRWWSCWRA